MTFTWWYAVSTNSAFIISLLFTYLLLLSNRINPVNRWFSLICTAVGIFCFDSFLAGMAPTTPFTVFMVRLLYAGPILSSVCLIRWALAVTKKQNKGLSQYIIFSYVGAAILMALSFTNYLIAGINANHFFTKFIKPGPLYPLFILFLVVNGMVGLYIFAKEWKISQGQNKNQLGYFIFATLAMYAGALIYFLNIYNVKIYPIGDFFSIVSNSIITYAIIKYRAMDIKLAIVKTGIFLSVYAFVLWFPFWVGYKTKSWAFSASVAIALTLIGQMIHRLLQKKAETILQKEQLSMRRALREFAGQVTQIKDFDTLYKETLNKTYELMRSEFAGLYVCSEKQSYTLQHHLSDNGYPRQLEFMPDHPLIIAIAQDRKPVFLDTVEGMPELLHEAIALPFYEGFKQKGVLCFLLLGPKKNKALYDRMDLDLFEILEAQVSLALENLSLLQDREFRILEEQRLSKMVIIGDIGTGVAHQMNNRFNSMIEAVQIHFGCYGKEMPDLKSLSRDDLEARYADAFSITKVVDIESHNGFKIAEAMLASAREPIGPQPFKIEYTLRLALDLLKAKKNLKRINIIEDIPLDSPFVWASTACIQDVLYNLVDNAADADEDKMSAIASGKLKPEDNKYEPRVTIRAHVVENNLFLVEVEDNGIGIEEKHVESVGQPCYSTKAWKKMGTGYGVATVKKLLVQSGSKLEIRSIHGKGSVFSFALPLATKAQIEEHEKQKPKKD